LIIPTVYKTFAGKGKEGKGRQDRRGNSSAFGDHCCVQLRFMLINRKTDAL